MNRERLVAAAASGAATRQQIAADAGTSVRTVYRKLRDPTVQQDIALMKAELARRELEIAQGWLDAVDTVVREQLQTGTRAERLKTAEWIITNARAMQDTQVVTTVSTPMPAVLEIESPIEDVSTETSEAGPSSASVPPVRRPVPVTETPPDPTNHERFPAAQVQLAALPTITEIVFAEDLGLSDQYPYEGWAEPDSKPPS